MTDKQPMQADGEGTAPHDPDGSGEVASRRDSTASRWRNGGFRCSPGGMSISTSHSTGK